jgi:hypothetical protein
MPDQPVAHLPRITPPWEEVAHTFCGRKIEDVARMGTTHDYVALAKREGVRRAAYDYCQTCTERVRYSGTSWEANAIDIAMDWLNRGGRYGGSSEARDDITASLHALSALVDAHREEFDAHRNAGKSGATSLTAKRAEARRPKLRGV